jgi:Spermine/spermidine synthase domain
VDLTRRFLRLTAFALSASLSVPVVTGFCSRLLAPTPVSAATLLPYAVAAVFVAIVAWLLVRTIDAAVGSLDDLFGRQVTFLDGLPETRLDLAIAGSAALSLFLELAVIRWQGTVFEFFAFYKNFSLLCCFAGLGLGYSLASRDRIPLAVAVPLLVWQFLFLTAFRHGLRGSDLASVSSLPFREQLNMGVNAVSTLAESVATYYFLAVTFVLTALIFVPIGQVCGRLMRRRQNLRAYGLNLIGSLIGVALTSVVSFLWTPPVVWYSLAFVGLLLLLPRSGRAVVWTGCIALVGSIVLAWPVEPMWQIIYSPYQNLAVGHTKSGLMEIRAAGQYYQRVHDFSADRELSAENERDRNYYDLPYRVHGNPLDVAVVGAGTGNDVAAAVRARAEHIDAIEIDPAILALGRANHPEHPYDQPEVRAIVNDARTFLRTTERRYDMIVYGLLDSHTLLSHASSVRLDSFVYTVEGLKDARAKLKEGGILSLSFALGADEVGGKIQRMLSAAFDGVAPRCVEGRYDYSVTFFQAEKGTELKLSEAAVAAMGFRECSGRFASRSLDTDVSTDDWPFFYMPKRTYPTSYLAMIAVIVLISFFMIGHLSQRPSANHMTYFLLGAGFMLVETKAITEMGLAFGNTWLVIGIVIGGILFMAFCANYLVMRLDLRSATVPYVLLLSSLVFGMWIARSGGLAPSFAGQLGTIAVLTSPMLFSGIVFSSRLANERDIAGAMSANLFGAMCGGLLEYNSMYFGFQFLYILAAALYAGAFLSSLQSLRPATSTAMHRTN